jgi:hypothetical protein
MASLAGQAVTLSLKPVESLVRRLIHRRLPFGM